MDVQPCPGCGALVPDVEGPVHRYLGASAGCWAIFGEVLKKEYGDYRYWPVHHLTVDAYAAQHPGTPSPQTIRSVAVHLIGLHLFLATGLLPTDRAMKEKQRAANRKDYVWLDPPASLGEVTLVDVRQAETPTKHKEFVEKWAESVWKAWEPHHEIVRRWAS
ncbi:hypothetical protein BH23ACT11_BH23ACT11_21050 [soil metagenome]